jgi:hypothetical protein
MAVKLKIEKRGDENFREDFLEIGQSETRIACGGHVYDGSGRNEQSL